MSENMNETMNENEGVTVTLTLDNDETLECAVLTIYEAAGRQYIALLPLDENGEESEESDVYIYRFSTKREGEISFPFFIFTYVIFSTSFARVIPT